jgi:hypothetical protein
VRTGHWVHRYRFPAATDSFRSHRTTVVRVLRKVEPTFVQNAQDTNQLSVASFEVTKAAAVMASQLAHRPRICY